ncbi:MAG: glycosyl transferase [Proteobacteria bacterium]|nr:glycosyl transferase [Pseudomonadota bacterium]
MIPNTGHFIWLGKNFPWVYMLAVRSAALKGGFERVVFHHEDELSHEPYWDEFVSTPGIEHRRIQPPDVLRETGPRGRELAALYDRLTEPAAKANMIRAAVLAIEGGVYLDTDTITLKPLSPLLDTGVFCGVEHIALPFDVMESRNPMVWAKAGFQLLARDLCRRLPNGWRWFRRIESFYPAAVNNAVLGARAHHPFIMDLLETMVTMPPKKQLVRFSLGTNLLQAKVADYREDDFQIHSPSRFYPLAPEISQHWFRMVDNPSLDEVVKPETTVVHWYASVHTKNVVPKIDPSYVRLNAHRQLFSALARPFI